MSKWNGDKARHEKRAKKRALLRLKNRTLKESLTEQSKEKLHKGK